MAVLFDSRVTFANALGFLSFEEQVAGTCPKNSHWFEFVGLVAGTSFFAKTPCEVERKRKKTSLTR